MKMRLVIAALLFTSAVSAQTVQEGRKLLLSQRYRSAKETLEKVVASTPTNPEAIYWLAQANFESKNPAAAKQILLKGMEGANGSNPLLLVAMGQSEITEKKINDAKQRFETAISLTKSKDASILVAIGKANLEDGGDYAYGIEKLKLAATLKNFNDPFAYVYMGDLYRKLMDGGGAVSSYENALLKDPKSAVAKYKIGKVYLTQGNEQKDIFLGKFNDAITDDPTFAPALYELYVYYFFRDVVKATDFFNKYKINADAGPALDYEEASLQFAAGDFKNAIAKSDALLKSQGENADARLYRLKAYSYDKLNDSANALSLLETFFQKATPEQLNPENYYVAAVNAAKMKSDPAKVDDYFMKAINADTAITNKLDYAKKAADFFKKSANTAKSALWLTKVLGLNPKTSKVDLYNAGFENFKAGEFKTADSIFSVYKTNFPNEVYGHYWSFRSLSVIDSTMEGGLAIPDCEKFISIAETDKAKNKSTLITAYGYLAGYTANIKKDLALASSYLDKIIEIDPNNQDAIKNRDILQKALAAPPKK
ncbi:MAG: tetratricopeptide repeat protein [Chitinophagaceae bacterium]